ncbi:MAG: macro domain-containing protein [Candidatus Eremiobacteraeota bacterium]|nr:macro domain-containing protein [Candidatus Eremiobacteraeota bacterium]MBV9648259.1 macro domain-containing protein [Candidatus Eremiobacteraeota bacterium]
MDELRIGATTIALEPGDITRVHAEAIVNAANAHLAGGGGVDGAIHRAGGPSIMEECRRIGACKTGGAVLTGAGNLPSRYVIHAVAPRYAGRPRDGELLRSAYGTALDVACKLGLRTIAFPSLGTGAYGYPIDEAADIALSTARGHALGETTLERITFVLFSERDLAAFRAALGRASVHKG